MSKLPGQKCLLATLFSLKFSICYVIFAESLSLFITNSPLINVTVRGIDYSIVVVLFMVMTATILIFETILMISMFTNHFNFTNRLNIADTLIQMIFFLPILITLIIFASISSTVKPHWESSFKLGVNYTTLDTVQRDAFCCGYDGPEYWNDTYFIAYQQENYTSSDWKYPVSCCRKNNCTVHGTFKEERVYDIGCFPHTSNFVHRFTLVVSILLLVFTLLSFPRNLWLYRYIEICRRKEREQKCASFSNELQSENDASNRQCGGVTSLQLLPISGAESEKDSMLTSDDTHIHSSETITKNRKTKADIVSKSFNISAAEE
uniref:Tetraspanin n=1 Tax=Panagrolaimus superbus TaxID=310955 RepID=A0A914YC02_9BILA